MMSFDVDSVICLWFVLLLDQLIKIFEFSKGLNFQQFRKPLWIHLPMPQKVILETRQFDQQKIFRVISRCQGLQIMCKRLWRMNSDQRFSTNLLN